MSFIGAAAAVLGTTGAVGIGTTMLAGAMMGGATTIGRNLIRGNDPFDNIGQGILMGAVSRGIFGGAGGAAAGEGAINAGGLDGAMGDSVSAYNTNMGVNSGNAAVNTIANTANPIAGMPSDKFGFDSPLATSQTFSPNSQYWSQSASANPVMSDAPPPQAGQIVGRESSVGFREAGGRLAGTDPKTNWLTNPATPANNFNAPAENYYNAPANTSSNPFKLNAMSPSGGTPASTASPKFSEDMLGYLTHKDNRLQVAAGGLGLAGAMGAFNRNTGLNNLPPRAYQRVNTSYNPGTVNPKYGMPGEPYFVGQGYGPETRETFYGAAGGGIRSLSGGGETYVPMTARGKMTIKENVPDDLDDSAAFKQYLKSDINKKEEKGQAEIDKNVSSWLERYAKADIKGMAEGGPAQQVTQFNPMYYPAQQGIGSLPYQAPNVPAMESSPTDYNQSPQYAPTTSYSAPAANPMTAGLGSYLEGLKYKAPPVASPVAPPTYRDSWAAVAPPGTPASYENPPPALIGAGREGYSSGDDAGGGYGDGGGNDAGGGYGDGGGNDAGGGYDPVTQTYSETTPTSPTLYSPDTQTYSETTPSPTLYNPDTQRYSDNPAFTAPVAPVAEDSGSYSGYFYDAEGNLRSVYEEDEDGNRRYNDDGSSLYYNDGEKAGGPITSKRYAMGGLAALPEYAAGGKLLSGDGDGMSDCIPAVIKGERPQRAALADGEFVIPADVVSHLGNGSTKAGGKRLYEMMANIRKARTGNSKQGKQINPMKFMPT